MNYTIDRIINNIAICENTENGENIELSLSILPDGIKEGTVITQQGDKYILNPSEELKRRERIQEKLNRLKNLKSKEQ